MPIYRNLERKFSTSSASSLDRLGKNKFKRVRYPRNRFKKRCLVQRNNGSSEWVVTSQDGDKMSFQANSQMTKNFIKIHTIGEGGFGTVVKVKHKIDNGFYAIKCILLNLMDSQSNKIMKEVKLLSQLIHDNIVRYYGTWTDDCIVDEARFSATSSFINSSRSSDIVFQNESNIPADQFSKGGQTQVLCIQMEFCRKTLADAIVSNLHKKQLKAKKIFWDIVQGLAYLNKKGIIHRDLKPQNIFLDADDRVKIGDFGLATKIYRGSSTKEHITNSLSADIGTYFYRAPELNLVPEGSRGRAKYGQEVDIYSLGIILFEMFHPPFSTGSERCDVLSRLREKEIIMPKEFVEDEKNTEVIPLIRLLLNHSANVRPTCADLLSMQKSKQLTNHRKSFQKQIKRKENINPIQPAYVFPGVREHLGNAENNGDILKLQSVTKKDYSMRYRRDKENNQDIQRGVIMTSRKGYFPNLLLKFQQEIHFELACIAGPIEAVTPSEVKQAVLKSIGYPDRQIPKIAKHLVKFFNGIISTNRQISDVWQNFNNFGGNLTDSVILETVYMIKQSWENVLAFRLARLVTHNSYQFTSGVGTNGAINCMKVLMERYRSIKKDVHLLFIRLEKDQVPPELIWTALRAQFVPEQYIDLMKNVSFNVPTGTFRPTIFNKKKHQTPGAQKGSALSSLLFNTVVNYVTEDLHHPAIWALLYENHIVLASETVEVLQNDFYSWCNRLESRGLNVLRKETEFLCCNFSNAKTPPSISDKFVLAGPLQSPLIDEVVNRLLK